MSVIKRENREREKFQKIGEEWDIAKVEKTRGQERFRGREEKSGKRRNG